VLVWPCWVYEPVPADQLHRAGARAAGPVAELELVLGGHDELRIGDRAELDPVERALHGAEPARHPGAVARVADQAGLGLDIEHRGVVGVHRDVEPAVGRRDAERDRVVRVVGAQQVWQHDGLPGACGQPAAGHDRGTARRVPRGVLKARVAQDRALLVRGIIDQAIERHEVQRRGIELGVAELDHPGRRGGDGRRAEPCHQRDRRDHARPPEPHRSTAGTDTDRIQSHHRAS